MAQKYNINIINDLQNDEVPFRHYIFQRTVFTVFPGRCGR